MFDVTNGVITLCKSGLKIDKNTTPEDLEKNIPDQIIWHSENKSGAYSRYYCWLDIEPDHLISSCFFFRVKRKLVNLDLCPSETPESTGHEYDCLLEWDIAEKWLRQYLNEDEKRYMWGKITLVRSDWDFPTRIVIKFS